jgi:hypothetical protein
MTAVVKACVWLQGRPHAGTLRNKAGSLVMLRQIYCNINLQRSPLRVKSK